METPTPSFEDTWAFVAFFVISFPVLFVTIWCFVLWITSKMSGWNRLAALYPHTGEEAAEWMPRGGGGVYRAGLPFAGMRGRLAVGATQDGIVIQPPRIVRPFHPALFLPFDKIVAEEDKRLFSFDFVMITLQGAPDIRVGILKSAREMVARVRAEH